MLKRLFDIIFSALGLVLLSPLFCLVALLILFSSKGPMFFLQTRVGKNGRDFKLFKFRTMVLDADQKGLLTVGGRDPRITNIGYFLRKYKIDELPQLLNVFFGTMSLVGPRPEVRKYVDLYNTAQKKILNVKPGLTDYASLEYFNENEILAKSENPEETYIKRVMPEKLRLNEKYLHDASLTTDLCIIFKTLKKILQA